MSKLFSNISSHSPNRIGAITWQYTLLPNHLVLNGEKKINVSVIYPELLDFFQENNLLTSTEADYLLNKALGYYDETEDSLLLPDFMNKTLWGSNEITDIGAGLPNIKSTTPTTLLFTDHQNSNGAFVNGTIQENKFVTLQNNTDWKLTSLQFDASKSNTIYGNSQTVQPPAISLIPQIRYQTDEDFPPIGTIIHFMGTKPPVGYLKCDGTIYEISKYRRLANVFFENFGSINKFGGDGTDTFAVPDLRGEFLRGTGTNSHTNQGSGAELAGIHQDATQILEFYAGHDNNNNYFIQAGAYYSKANNTTEILRNQKADSVINADAPYTSNTYRGSYSTNSWTTDLGQYATTRPTNTSVLYCIKF